LKSNFGVPLRQWPIKKAANIIKHGGVIVYPTEAVYGLGCDPLNPHAVARILTLKHRNIDKGLLLISAHFSHVSQYIHSSQQGTCAALFLATEKETREAPVAITWLFKAADHVPFWLTGNHSTIAIRFTQHPIAKAICELWGQPIISTSANISTQRPLNRKVLAYKIFYKKVDYMVAGPLGKQVCPSEIRDVATGQVVRKAH